MNKIVTSAAALALFSLSYGSAQAGSSAGNDVTLNATVLNTCTLPGAAPQTLDIGARAIDAADATVNSASILEVTYEGAMCNYRAYIGVKTKNGGLTPGNVLANTLPSPAANFINRIDYLANATWGTLTTDDLSTSGTPGAKQEKQATSAQIGDVTLRIWTVDGATPVEANSAAYTDVVTVQVGGQL